MGGGIEITKPAAEEKKPKKKPADKDAEILRLTNEMQLAAHNLQFELAAKLRDEIKALKGE